MNLVIATIFLVHRHLSEFTGDVVGGARVSIPVGIDPIGVVHGGCCNLLARVVFRVALVTVLGNMVFFAYLTFIFIAIIPLKNWTPSVVVVEGALPGIVVVFRVALVTVLGNMVFFAYLTFIFIAIIPLKNWTPSVVVVEGALPGIVVAAGVLVATATTSRVLVVTAATTAAVVVVVATTTAVVIAAATSLISTIARSAAAAVLGRIATTTATTPRGHVSGGFESTGHGAVEHLHALIKVGHHREEIVNRNCVSLVVEGKDDGLIVHIKPGYDVRDELILAYGFASGC